MEPDAPHTSSDQAGVNKHHDLQLNVPAATPSEPTTDSAGAVETPYVAPADSPAAWNMSAPTPAEPAQAVPAAPEPTAEAWRMPDPIVVATSIPVADPIPSAPVANVSADWATPSSGAVASGLSQNAADPLRPVAVVRVLSPVGVEYVFLTFALITGAIGLASSLLALVNGKADFTVLAFPAALLLISVPLFAVIFLHLKRMETNDPALKLDPSKRRSTQFTQIASFATCFFTLIGLVSIIFAKMGGASGVSIGKAFLDAIVVLLVAGGILVYYWLDEHKPQ